MRGNSITERWIGRCRRELLDQTLVWNQRHLMMVLREYEDFCNSHPSHRALDQAAPLRPLPDRVTDWDHSGSGDMTARAASSTNIAWWHRFSAPKSARPRVYLGPSYIFRPVLRFAPAMSFASAETFTVVPIPKLFAGVAP
jgi:hypothetical protein